MAKKNNYLNEISEIRYLMERSSKFMSLSGISGVFVGIYAIAGALVAHLFIQNYGYDVLRLSLLATAVLTMAIITVLAFSYRKSIRMGEAFFNKAATGLFYVMSVPLITGGVLIIVLILKDMAELALPMSLVFYGLAMYGAGRYTYKELYSLGVIQIISGLLSLVLISYSLLFWAVGFGFINIFYGVYLYINHEK